MINPNGEFIESKISENEARRLGIDSFVAYFNFCLPSTHMSYCKILRILLSEEKLINGHQNAVRTKQKTRNSITHPYLCAKFLGHELA
jgi:hypothetical protein